MKRVAITIKTVLLLVGLAGLAYSHQTWAQSEAGWVVLFDGKSLDHWNKIGDANWRIEDGAVVADKGNGFLVSNTTYNDFQLRAEFWVDDDANSGIFIRCTDPNNVGAKHRLRGQHLGPATRPELWDRRDCQCREGVAYAQSRRQMERV